jgi:predicted component of type VI protein secretion system
VLEISHPTISALEQGTSSARVGDLFDRLVEVHEVVRRVHLIADRDALRTSQLLSTQSESGGIAKDLLAERRPAEAYLAALDAQSPRRAGTMMQSIWPARAGDATVDLAVEPE